MYNPQALGYARTPFFMVYNSASYTYPSNGSTVTIDASIPSIKSAVDSSNHTLSMAASAWRSDALMTPVTPSDYSTFGNLYSNGETNIIAYQDHPSRTSFHAAFNDDLLFGDKASNTETSDVRFSPTGSAPSFTVAIGKAVTAGVRK